MQVCFLKKEKELHGGAEVNWKPNENWLLCFYSRFDLLHFDILLSPDTLVIGLR